MIIKEHKIISELYEKNTNSYQYSNRKPGHPYHVRKLIAYGLSVRATRICSAEDKGIEIQVKMIANYPLKCGHNDIKVDKQMKKVG